MEKRSRIETLGWMAFGLAGSIGGAVIAFAWTTFAIRDHTGNDFVGLWYVFTIPFGFGVGVIAATIAAAIIERRNRNPAIRWSRTVLAFAGSISPVLFMILSWIPFILAGAVAEALGIS